MTAIIQKRIGQILARIQLRTDRRTKAEIRSACIILRSAEAQVRRGFTDRSE